MICFKMINQAFSYAGTMQKQTFQFIQFIDIDLNMNIASQYQQIQSTFQIIFSL